SVIACIGAAEGDAADTDRLGIADVLIGETGAGGSLAQAVARHAVVRECDGGGRGGIIDLVDTDGSYRQSPRGDVGRCARSTVSRVVGGIGAAEGDAADVDALGSADIFIGEAGLGVGVGQAVAADAVVGQGDGGIGSAVINLIE